MKAISLWFLVASAYIPAVLTADPLRSSSNYTVPSETVDLAGSNAQSASYTLRASALGELGMGDQSSSMSASYVVKSGYAGQISDLLMRAVSRLSHNSAGAFDVNLPLTGTPGIEPRGSSTYQLVLTFANPLVSVQGVSASASGALQPNPPAGLIDAMDPHNYIVSLSSVPNAQAITVSLAGVNDADANSANSLPLTFGLLIGDANGDGVVNSADATITRNRSGQETSAANFRADYNLDGFINSADATIVRSRSGTFIP